MTQVLLKVEKTESLCENVFKTVFKGDVSDIRAPGQFVNVRLDGLYLRRPISVCDLGEGELTLVYKVVGKGTQKLSESKKGDEFDVLTGLGNGYDLSKSGDKPLLIGGGVYSYFYACGPEPMLKAVYKATATEGELSFEERMGCGFGACMGCSCKTLTGNKRICKDGPVMKKGEILW